MHAIDHSENIIELREVCFAYGDIEVLHEVNLDVHRGDYLGIVGPNGGGKTTLLRVLLGLVKPDSGTVQLFGASLDEFDAWSKIGYVPQKANSFDPRFPATVAEVVRMGLVGKRGLGRRFVPADKQAVHAALERVGMERLERRMIGDLSGGQQQRVFIARALVHEPEVLILDEPTAGVDEASQQEFYGLLRRLNREQRLTLILVSHDRDVIEAEAMEIATINKVLRYEKNY